MIKKFIIKIVKKIKDIKLSQPNYKETPITKQS